MAPCKLEWQPSRLIKVTWWCSLTGLHPMHDFITISREYHSSIIPGIILNLRVSGCEDNVRNPRLVKLQTCVERASQVELQSQLDILIRWLTDVMPLYACLEALSDEWTPVQQLFYQECYHCCYSVPSNMPHIWHQFSCGFTKFADSECAKEWKKHY